MALVTVTVTGASHDATLTWKGTKKALGGTGGGNFGTSFPEQPGPAIYALTILGTPSDPWTARVTDGTKTFNHSGHVSPSGTDTTGDTLFTVS